MVAYSFQREFAADIVGGIKRSTIRPERRPPCRHARPGERLQLYIDMRRTTCRKLLNPDPVCAAVNQIEIVANSFTSSTRICWVTLDGGGVFGHCLDRIVLKEGFRSHHDFFQWFHAHYGLPFKGVLVQWQPAPGDAEVKP